MHLVEREAEAERLAIAAEKVKTAQALEEAYASEQKAETARSLREKVNPPPLDMCSSAHHHHCLMLLHLMKTVAVLTDA